MLLKRDFFAFHETENVKFKKYVDNEKTEKVEFVEYIENEEIINTLYVKFHAPTNTYCIVYSQENKWIKKMKNSWADNPFIRIKRVLHPFDITFIHLDFFLPGDDKRIYDLWRSGADAKEIAHELNMENETEAGYHVRRIKRNLSWEYIMKKIH